MWHIVSAEPGAELLFGLKPGFNKQDFLAAWIRRLKTFLPFPVRAGDTFFVPPGTPHAIGPG